MTSSVIGTFHISWDIAFLLTTYDPLRWQGLFHDVVTGEILAPEEAKKFLEEELARGCTVMLGGTKSECPYFDSFGGGCPGHEGEDLGKKRSHS